ncbi:hypothetical protein DR864_11275 [Runella rosea]|uniref:Fibronectin type-III domain-containing protein n=1 Tax=Runella rosea TaxID=2259595 RepID=A0A344TI13_9BACT|nr:hypothetical protein [Runella rosea]AXE18284.1 hypothetical protein DR864_11275 [Runella rosea]
MKIILQLSALLFTIMVFLYGCNDKKAPASPSAVPTLGTTTSGAITENSLAISSAIQTNGENSIIQHGYVYSETNKTPTDADSKITLGVNAGPFPATFFGTITGLKANTTYHIRSYATNSNGIGYGSAIEAKTSVETKAPTLETAPSVEEVTTGSFKLTASIKDNNGNPISQYGYVYSETNKVPTMEADSKTEMGAHGGPYPASFSGTIINLKANTLYYVRPYAANSKGTGYGPAAELKTKAELTVPTMEANATVEEIKTNSFKVTGTILNNGGSVVIQHGHVYSSTDKNPTTTGPNTQLKANNGPFPSKYVSTITNLSEGVTYFVRSYATNEKGTGYGTAIEVKTVATSAPILAANMVIDAITYNSISVSNTINSDGNLPITQHGHLLSVKNNPTIETLSGNGVRTQKGEYTGAFPKPFSSTFSTGLDENTTYYLRPYAINAKGTTYGTTVPIKTQVATPTFTKPTNFEDVPVYSIILETSTSTIDDGDTDSPVSVEFNPNMGGTENTFFLDLGKLSFGGSNDYPAHSEDDREKGQVQKYYIATPAVKTIKDIIHLTLRIHGDDGWAISKIRLIVNGYELFTKSYQNHWIEDDKSSKNLPTLTIPYNELRTSKWSYAGAPSIHIASQQIKAQELVRLMEGIMGDELESGGYKSGSVGGLFNGTLEWDDTEAVKIVPNNNSVYVRFDFALKLKRKNTTDTDGTFSFALWRECQNGSVTFKITDLQSTNNNFPAGSFRKNNIENAIKAILTRTLNIPCKAAFNSAGDLIYW